MNFGASDPLQNYQIASFGGVDFSTLENKVDMTRSPDAVNMIMNHNGYLEKRTGYRRLYRGEGRINGIFDYTPADAAETFWFLHEGTKLYRVWFENGKITKTEFLMDGLKNTKSRHFVFGGKLYIIGAGYVQIAYKNGGLEYGIVNEIGTDNGEAVSYSQGDNFNTRARFKQHIFDLSVEVRTQGQDSGKRIRDESDNVVPSFALPSSADLVKVEAVYVYGSKPNENTYEWHPWDLDFASISNDGKTITLYGNPIYGADGNYDGYGDKAINPLKFSRVKIVYHEMSDVASPLMFIHRTAIPLKNEMINYIFSYGDHTKESWTEEAYRTAAVLDGDLVDSANFAHGRRRIQFKIPTDPPAGTGSYALYLTGANEKALVNSISVDGVIVQNYKLTKTYVHALSSSVIGCEYDTVDTITVDDSGRVIRIWKKVLSATWSGSGPSVTKKDAEADANANVLPGSVIEVDFTVLRDEASDDEQISACSIYGIYGGNNDTRVFLAGNPKFKNRDYASALYDATYFPNNMYTDVGSEASAIVGYQKLYANQIIVKDDATEDASQYLRSLHMDEAGNVTYTLQQGNSTYGASCRSSFKHIGGIPFYIGPGGVYTIAGTTVQNQNNTTLRSLQINKRFLREDLENAVCCRYDDFYIVACKNHMWLCDTANALEWFFFDGLPEVTCILSHGNRLYFGTADGRVCVFSDREDKDAYYDNVSPDGGLQEASPVQCHWCTPISAFGSWNMLKTVVNVYLSCMPYNESSVHVYYNSSDEIGEDITTESIALFDFADVNFDNFSFDSIRQPKPFATGVKAKNVYVFGVKLENAEAQPFGIVSVGYKYRFSKYVK